MISELVFSFLASTKKAVETFVKESAKHLSGTETSNHIKMMVYSDNYNIKFREKYTGFEEISDLDAEIRQKLKDHLGDKEIQNLYEDMEHPEVDMSFREALTECANEYKDTYNVIYLSGGADSEVTARAFLDAGIEFVPYVFEWTNADGKVLNNHDTVYAYQFCEEYDLTPEVRSFDVETFWKSDEIYDLCDKYNTSSPQLLTYRKMVLLVDKELEDEIE